MMQRRHQLILDIVGWYGMAAVLAAYGLVNLTLLPSHNIVCILLNLTGSAGLIIAAFVKRANQLVVLNIVWAIVALMTLAQIFIK